MDAVSDSMEGEVPSAEGVGHDGVMRSLRAVGDEIRNAEEQIRRLEEEVKKVGKRIETVELQISCTSDRKQRVGPEKTLDYLRVTEHGLRQKKHDLWQGNHDHRQRERALRTAGSSSLQLEHDRMEGRAVKRGRGAHGGVVGEA